MPNTLPKKKIIDPSISMYFSFHSPFHMDIIYYPKYARIFFLKNPKNQKKLQNKLNEKTNVTASFKQTKKKK